MTQTTRRARIGVDVGGTFTDLVLHDPVRDVVHTGKLLTTPDDPSRAIVEGVVRILREAGLDAADLHSIVHGTTLVTNTIIERTGATVGLITTQGFRDSIEMGKETRYDLYDLFIEMPSMLVPRHRRMEVPERFDVNGQCLIPLDEEAVKTAVRTLVERENIQALAIGFLHAHHSPQHEERAATLVHALYPGLAVSISSRVAPEIREYERVTTACANAYVQPMMTTYLDKLEIALKDIGFLGNLYVMLSGGGITTVREAKAYPIRLIESGPAAGAMAASFLSRHADLKKVVSFDMGGTTAKMCLVEDGEPHHKYDFEAGRVRRFQKGSGLPLKVSVVDMIEIGAGGGSLAHIDAATGLMKVGPRSAGSVPGPVCYGRGGTQPVVTDADLVLGRLDPKYFLGGELALDLDGVKFAFEDKLGKLVDMSVDQAALGVQRIVDETMAAATRMHLAEKGRDPREYTMIAFGGAGPVHAYNLALILKMRRLVVPLGAGVASALGFLVAPPATDMVRSHVGRLSRMDWDKVNAHFAAMKAEGSELLLEAGAEPAAIRYDGTAEMRHVGQGFEISVPLPAGELSAASVDDIKRRFFSQYRERFGRTMEDSEIEAVNWRLKVWAPGTDVYIGKAADVAASTVADAKRTPREVLFPFFGHMHCEVYDRYKLPIGGVFDGPALVEERESTCVIGPGARAHIDSHRNLVIDLPAEAAPAGT